MWVVGYQSHTIVEFIKSRSICCSTNDDMAIILKLTIILFILSDKREFPTKWLSGYQLHVIAEHEFKLLRRRRLSADTEKSADVFSSFA